MNENNSNCAREIRVGLMSRCKITESMKSDRFMGVLIATPSIYLLIPCMIMVHLIPRYEQI